MNNYVWIFFISALIAALSQVILKKAALNPTAEKNKYLRILTDWRIIFAYGLLFFTTVLNMIGYRSNPLSVGALINASSFVFVGILSVLIFKEKMPLKKVLAYILIVLGVVVILV